MPIKPLPLPDTALTGLQAPHGDGLLSSHDWYDWFRTLEGSGGGASFINVVTIGADPTGVKDSLPAFRAAAGSDRIIFVPPGEYLFNSMYGPSNPAENPASLFAWEFWQYDNWAIFGYGATINVSAEAIENGGSVIQVDTCNNWRIYGLTINQSPVFALFGPGVFNPGIGIAACVNFHISDIVFGSGLDYQAFVGNYMVDGTIDNIWMSHGQFGDFANIVRMRFDNITADGGNDSPTGLWLGVAGDPATPPSRNTTGITINDSENIKITRCNVSGYAVGVLIREGQYWYLSNNHWFDLPGGSAAPVAIYIRYEPGAGQGNSTGRPPRSIIISNEVISDIGATTPGYGIIIDAAGIVNADIVKNIVISTTIFDNISFCGVSLQAGSEPFVANLVFGAGNILDDLGVMTLPLSPEFEAEADIYEPVP